MQIWNSPFMFVLIKKQNFAFLILRVLELFTRKVCEFFFSMWIFIHEHSQIQDCREKGRAFLPLHGYLEISQVITAETSPLHSGWTRTGNLVSDRKSATNELGALPLSTRFVYKHTATIKRSQYDKKKPTL